MKLMKFFAVILVPKKIVSCLQTSFDLIYEPIIKNLMIVSASFCIIHVEKQKKIYKFKFLN